MAKDCDGFQTEHQQGVALSEEPVAIMVLYPDGRTFLTTYSAHYQWVMQNERRDWKPSRASSEKLPFIGLPGIVDVSLFDKPTQGRVAAPNEGEE